jgi:hypothetical protein
MRSFIEAARRKAAIVYIGSQLALYEKLRGHLSPRP